MAKKSASAKPAEKNESKPKRSTPKKKQNASDSSEAKNDKEEFPGYPPYSPGEDIMNRPKDEQRAPADIEDFIETGEVKTENQIRRNSGQAGEFPVVDEDEEERPELTETDVTPEEKKVLGSENLHNDLGDDDQLRDRIYPVDMAGEDLDVPGSELDDADEDIGEEDEENNEYSQADNQEE